MTTPTPQAVDEPAFPADGTTGRGMTLRDYFAAKAMQALVAPADAFYGEFLLEAKAAYRIADAMLKERAK